MKGRNSPIFLDIFQCVHRKFDTMKWRFIRGKMIRKLRPIRISIGNSVAYRRNNLEKSWKNTVLALWSLTGINISASACRLSDYFSRGFINTAGSRGDSCHNFIMTSKLHRVLFPVLSGSKICKPRENILISFK